MVSYSVPYLLKYGPSGFAGKTSRRERERAHIEIRVLGIGYRV